MVDLCRVCYLFNKVFEKKIMFDSFLNPKQLSLFNSYYFVALTIAKFVAVFQYILT